MSEESTSVEEMIDETVGASVSDDVPQVTETEVPGLGVADLKLMANVLEVVSNRGAIRANEMAAVGQLYNTLMTFLIANGAITPPNAQEVDAEASEQDETGE